MKSYKKITKFELKIIIKFKKKNLGTFAQKFYVTKSHLGILDHFSFV